MFDHARARSRHGPALARQPSCLRNPPRLGGVTTAAVRSRRVRVSRGSRRAASASACGPWPCSLGSSR